MVNWLFGGLVFAPLAAAVLLPFLRRARARILRRWLAGVAALATACAIGLLFFIGETPTIAFTWLPGTGEMGFSLERAGLLAALATSATAAFVFAGTARTLREASISARLAGMVWLVTLAAANAAFLSAHFLARYVALEVVGLCIALAALIEIGEMRGLRRGGLVYLLLRIGDAGLLTAILLLGARTGTLEIGPALAAAPTLSARALAWVTAGFALAVSVKIGLWPFHFWVRVGQSLSRPSDLWLYATVMPNLGLYLLYRTAPLLALPGALNTALLLVGAISGGAALAVMLFWPLPELFPVYVMAAQGGLAMVVAAGGGGAVLPWAILVFTAVRPLLWLVSRMQGRARVATVGLSGSALLLFWIWALTATLLSPVALVAAGGLLALTLMWMLLALPKYTLRAAPAWLQRDWEDDSEAALTRFATRFHDLVEVRVLERGLDALAAGLMRFAQRLYRFIEMGVLEHGVDKSATGMIETSEAVYQTVEQDRLEGSVRGLVRAVRAGGHALRALHAGRLRTNLMWVALTLLTLVLMLVLTG